MYPGQKVVVKREIIIDGKTALHAGDQVIIQNVFVGLGPAKKYAVYSKALEHLVWLQSRELAFIKPVPKKQPTVKVGGNRRRWWLYLAVAGLVVATALAVSLSLLLSTGGVEKLTAEQALEHLRNCSSEVDQYIDAMRTILIPGSRLSDRLEEATKVCEQYCSPGSNEATVRDESLESRLQALMNRKGLYCINGATYKVESLPTYIREVAQKYWKAFKDATAVEGLEQYLVRYTNRLHGANGFAPPKEFGTLYVDSREVEEVDYYLYLNYRGDYVSGESVFQWGQMGNRVAPLQMEYDLITEAIGQRRAGDDILSGH